MSLKDDYILMILSCKKYLKERREGQIEQFLKNNETMQGIQYFHLEGDQTKFVDNPELKYIVDEKNNIIYTNTKDDYLSLPHKIICGLTAIYDNYKFEYILKTDDDQRLLVLDIFKQIHPQLKEKKPDYFGRIGYMQEQEERGNPIVHAVDGFPKGYIVGDGLPFGHGRLYGLSHRNVEFLVKNKYENIKKELAEDWAIAKNQKVEYRKNCLFIETNSVFMDYEKFNKLKL